MYSMKRLIVVQDTASVDMLKITESKSQDPAQTEPMQNSAPKQEVEIGLSAMSIIVFVCDGTFSGWRPP
jgi:hypothetical protein